MDTEDLIKIIKDNSVEQKNKLRFECTSMMEAALRASPSKFIACKFLKITMDSITLSACLETYDRVVTNNESFLTVTNDLNIRGLL